MEKSSCLWGSVATGKVGNKDMSKNVYSFSLSLSLSLSLFFFFLLSWDFLKCFLFFKHVIAVHSENINSKNSI